MTIHKNINLKYIIKVDGEILRDVKYKKAVTFDTLEEITDFYPKATYKSYNLIGWSC